MGPCSAMTLLRIMKRILNTGGSKSEQFCVWLQVTEAGLLIVAN